MFNTFLHINSESASVSESRRPNNTNKPGPISDTTLPSTSTREDTTRCTTALIDADAEREMEAGLNQHHPLSSLRDGLLFPQFRSLLFLSLLCLMHWIGWMGCLVHLSWAGYLFSLMCLSK
eukprot:c22327_g1_i2 orf=773-1135(+)